MSVVLYCSLKLAVAAAVCCLHGLPLFPVPLWTPAMSAQTKKGEVARSLSSMEFEDIMGQFRAAMSTPEKIQHKSRGERWQYSWDNDKIHQGADLERVGFREEDRYPLPPLSSDMHKVIENVHAWLQQQMEKWIEDQGDEPLEVESCKNELKRLFDDVYKPEWIQANVASLRETYEAIVFADGGYPAAAYR